MKREDVFFAINTEREYQKRRWGKRTNGTFAENPHTPAEFLTYMRHYLALADEAATMNSGDEVVLEMMRKVVAMGVACFEQNGVAPRDLNQPIVNGHDGQPA